VKRSVAPTWLKLVLVIAAAMVLATALDPYLQFDSPLAAQLVNAALPTIVVLLLWGLSGRAWFALLVEAALLALLAHADTTKVLYLNTDLVYADFKVLGGLLRDPQLVLGFVQLTVKDAVLVALLLLVVAALWWFTWHRRHASRRFRGACVAVGALAAAMLWLTPAPNVIKLLHWQVYEQANGAKKVGVAGNVLLGRMTTHALNPKPDVAAEQAFWNEPLVRQAGRQIDRAGDGRRPDIVIVQSESLFAPQTLRGFDDKLVLPHILGAGSPFVGELRVPVFGGRTLQTEFEMLTGAPIAFYPGSMFAYYELVDHPIDALPRVLGDLGYRTMVVHPNDRGFWRRGTAMPDLGFGSFQDIDSFLYPRDFSDRDKASDEALTRIVLAELDAANGPTLAFAISMENHGPWGAYAPKSDAALGLPAQLKGKARPAMADYVVHARDADRAFGFLVDALQRRGRPTLVLLYGDHLPALPRVYRQLGFKDGQAPETHHPPYRVWANFSLPPAPAVTSAYLLQGWLLRAAGLPLKGHVLANALAGVVAADPAASAADRQRVLDEYANIAAANVRATAKPAADAAPTLFFGRGQAQAALLAQWVAPATQRPKVVRDDDLYLDGSSGQPAQMSFATRAGIASLTLRPYVRTLVDADCVGQGRAENTARFTVTGDGRVLYRATVSRQTVRLATLDLQGVQQLELRADQFSAAGKCAGLYVRVAQLTCYAAQCDRPGPARPVGAAAPAASHILSQDPIGGDLAALARSNSRPRTYLSVRRANLRWLIGRMLAQQQGLAPFSIQPDAQLFMHPADDHPATVDFNVSGLDRLELTPHINSLSDECAGFNEPGKEAGVVGLSISLDGQPLLPRQLIDRSFQQSVPLTVEGGHDLRIEVDKGNQVSWCDWFSVGVDEISGPAFAPDATGATSTGASFGTGQP
jgi:hypothetical protein